MRAPGPYPAAAALRRRAARQQANGEAIAADPQRQNQNRQQIRHRPIHFSHVYCLFSAVLALMAVVLVGPTSNNSKTSTPSLFLDKLEAVDVSVVENVAKAAAIGLSSSSSDDEEPDALQRQDHHQDQNVYFWSKGVKEVQHFFHLEQRNAEETTSKQHSQMKHTSVPPFLRWMFPVHTGHTDISSNELSPKEQNYKAPLSLFIDPAILHPSPSSMTDIIDKVLTSTPRLLAICNLLVAMTWLVHSAVVEIFLGTAVVEGTSSWAGRERLGGFLVFKLLLISAVVVPDTLDLLILLSWYTLLSFLRSLAHLAAGVTAHTSRSGQAPRRGVLGLLLLVLVSDVVAAASCVALFHGAGWGMVLLLTCDCALLAVDTVSHLAKHASQAMEERHLWSIQELEEAQLDLHNNNNNITASGSGAEQSNEEEIEEEDGEDEGVLNDDNESEQLQQQQDTTTTTTNDDNDEESRRFDRRMELLETIHARRLTLLDTTVFLLQLVAYALTVAHFCHIWSLHGLQFTLIDGVLALHLHSAVSAAGRKIAERRNLNRIARALDGLFEDATELEMRKAMATGDVCCICLGTMSAGHVKKVGCGHLYHTHCLREVVERARSIEAARCPLCRASVVNGRHPSDGNGTNNEQQQQENVAGNNERQRDGAVQQQQQQPGLNNNNPGEHALFRFSTDSILPAWLPLPAFSFEIVRRPTVAQDAADAAAEAANNNGAAPPQQPQDNNNTQQQQQQSFWRRLLILAGAISMSAEEEAQALDQLVDMFPQYDRADLQRELRERGSAEAVVEAVLQGVFSGVARGQMPANEDAQEDDEDESLDNEEDELR